MIVEIGARNGGYRERMHGLANGIDILGCALEIAVGNKPNTTAKRDYPCAVLELFPKNTGEFIRINNESELLKLSSLIYLGKKAKTGQFVGKSADGHKMCAVVILCNQDISTFQRDLEYVKNNVYVITQ